jgi:hypothetical protein
VDQDRDVNSLLYREKRRAPSTGVQQTVCSTGCPRFTRLRCTGVAPIFYSVLYSTSIVYLLFHPIGVCSRSRTPRRTAFSRKRPNHASCVLWRRSSGVTVTSWKQILTYSSDLRTGNCEDRHAVQYKDGYL